MSEINKVITDSKELKWTRLPDDSPSYYLPRDGTPFLTVWKGRICLAEFDEEEGRFYIAFDISDYHTSQQISQDRENKFTHYMPLPELPKDYHCSICKVCPEHAKVKQ